MTVAAAVLAAALTRAEIIERFKAPPVTKVDGLVQVVADCPADMRREYQMPIAGFAAGVCRGLYAYTCEKPRRFVDPAIVVHIGDARTNITDVIVRVAELPGGASFTRIYLPAPAFADTDRLRLAVVQAFYRHVLGREIPAADAVKTMRDADPDLKVDFCYGEIERWMRGEPVEGDDEEMLRLCRAVLKPGVARQSDVLRFASRLYLYPSTYDMPFAGKYHCCTFAEALEIAEIDPRVRFAAVAKAPQVVLFGGGRGEELYAAAQAYAVFLVELARWKKPRPELEKMLEDAELKLNIAMEQARLAEKEGR